MKGLEGKSGSLVEFGQDLGVPGVEQIVAAGVVEPAGTGMEGPAGFLPPGDGEEVLQAAQQGHGIIVELEPVSAVPAGEDRPAGDEAADLLPPGQRIQQGAVAPGGLFGKLL